MSAPTYRPDIDGLRAIAVTAVLGFHAFPTRVPGGFVGVDVFFVISGYLITTIIVSDLRRGRFRFRDFYTRRIARIFPTLAIVLLAVLAYGWFALLPREFATVGKHVAAGAGFVSNFTLIREANYFDPSSDLKPLLHLWSLAIEEQFYLLWPLALFLVWRRPLIPIALGIAAASFAVNIAIIHSHPTQAFYQPVTRAWELMLGAALAVYRLDYPSRGPRHWGSVAGLGLILFAIAFLDGHTLMPGWAALLPTFGTLLLIAAGPDAVINRRVLALRPMVGIGLISYALYLWHWPLLSFARILQGPLSNGLAWGLLALATLLAWLTYVLVEGPIRRLRDKSPVVWPSLGGLTALGTAAVLAFIGTIPARIDATQLEPFMRVTDENAFPGPNLRALPAPYERLKAQGTSDREVLFIGDSNIEQYYPRIDWLETHGATKTAVFATGGGCPPIPGVTEAQHPHCQGLLETAAAYAKDSGRVDTVVVAGLWSVYLTEPSPVYQFLIDGVPLEQDFAHQQKSMKAFTVWLSSLGGPNRRVVLLLPLPYHEDLNPAQMVHRSLLAPTPRLIVKTPTLQAIADREARITNALTRAAATAGASTLDVAAHLCTETCSPLTPAGGPRYRDNGHLLPSYVRDSVSYLDGFLKDESAN